MTHQLLVGTVSVVDTRMGSSTTDNANQKPKGTAHAVAGGLAGACARLIVGPLDVVKIRMQVQLEPVSCSLNSKYTGLRQALVSIVKDEGVKVSLKPQFALSTTPGLARRSAMHCALPRR